MYAETEMSVEGVVCIDCHMPKAVKSAEGDASTYYGDVRTHMVKINTDPSETLTYIDSDGNEWGNGYVTLGWTCLTSGCHSSENIEFASENSWIAHETSAPEPEPESSGGIPGFGIEAVLVGLLVCVLLINYTRR